MSRSRRLNPVNIQEREKIARQKKVELKNTDRSEKIVVEKKRISTRLPKPSQAPKNINIQASILNTCTNLRGTCKNIRELADNVESLLGSVESFVPVLSSIASSYTKNLMSAAKEKMNTENVQKEPQAPIPEPPAPEQEPIKNPGMRSSESSTKIPAEKDLQQFLNNPLVKSAFQLLSQQLSKKNNA